MNQNIVNAFKIPVIAFVLILFLGGIRAVSADVNGHGVSYGPEFGGGRYYHYNDGLGINGNTFDISNYAQKIDTQTLYVGVPAQIKLKVFDNAGTYAIQGVAIFLNIRGSSASVVQSDTWIQYDKYGGVTTNDPYNILGNVKVDVVDKNPVVYVTFHITPKSPMHTSDMIVRALDYRLSTGDVLVTNAIKISYTPSYS